MISDRFYSLSNTERVALVYDELLTKLGENVLAPPLGMKMANLPVPSRSSPSAILAPSIDTMSPAVSVAIATSGDRNVTAAAAVTDEKPLDIAEFDPRSALAAPTSPTKEEMENYILMKMGTGAAIQSVIAADESVNEPVSVNTGAIAVEAESTHSVPLVKPSSASVSALAWINAAFSTTTEITKRETLPYEAPNNTSDGVAEDNCDSDILFINNENDSNNRSVKSGSSGGKRNSKKSLSSPGTGSRRRSFSRPNTSSSRKSDNSVESDKETLNPCFSLNKCAPTRNKIGSYFGHEMANLDVFRFLPSSTTPLMLIIEAKTPSQWKPGASYSLFYYFPLHLY